MSSGTCNASRRLPATLVFRNGAVLTADPARPVVDALAVAGDRIVAVGDGAGDLAGTGTEIVDLGGRCLLPGFRDGHVHPLSGGIEHTGLHLDGLSSVDEIVAAVAAYAAAHPEAPWIHGGGYDPTVLPGGIGEAAWLDRACPDRPVALASSDHHVAWVNGKALVAAGITASTPEPERGTIVRRGDGDPVGTLQEWGAIDLVEALIPAPTEGEQRDGMAMAMQAMAARGIVWAQDAAVTSHDLTGYLAAARAGLLPVRVNLAFRADPARWPSQRAAFGEHRHTVESDPAVVDHLSARTVKFFADGVLEAGTAHLLEPYVDQPHSCGLPNWAPGELAEAVAAFDADGFQIHIHAIGDAGVRASLDAIEHAATVNGRRDRRAVIAHTQLVDPADRPRFADLGVIANFEPLWACLDDCMLELTMPRLGPARSALQYPIATLAASGAHISFGSDWPVSSVAPLQGLAVAVTRQRLDGTQATGWLPEEQLPVQQAVTAYTAGTAFQAFEDGERGALQVGAVADLCLLSADITAMSGREIADVDVDGTWVAGRAIHRV